MTQELQQQPSASSTGPLTRSIPTTVLLGLGGMVGAGVFLGPAPAAALAGRWFLLALVLTALATTCFVLASAGASAAHGEPGGSYTYIRDQLGPVPARIAGALALAGRSAAAAAIAGTLGAYTAPNRPEVVAVAAIVLGVAFNVAKLRLRAWGWRLVPVVLAVLAVVVVAAFALPPEGPPPVAQPGMPGADNPRGLLAAAAVSFFHFAGFERLTSPPSPAERYPQRTLRIALPIVMVAAVVTQLIVGAALLYQLGAARLALSRAPLGDLLVAADAATLRPLVAVGAAAAMLPLLIVALAAIRNTAVAAIRGRDVPVRATVAVGRRGPWRLDVVSGGLAAALTVTLGPVLALQLAASCLLFYYAFASAAARLILQDGPVWPMRAACVGMVVSVILGMCAPVPLLIATLGIAAIGAGAGAVIARRW
ncbi:amino acid permease [Longimycelium tulufanense]|uniref:amino acid permease n=1 Tax=Longimycelium tulufanense TaxID=907463 RepID=UPI001666E800|nr:amino acid permease [Longimycelium tulufanense]